MVTCPTPHTGIPSSSVVSKTWLTVATSDAEKNAETKLHKIAPGCRGIQDNGSRNLSLVIYLLPGESSGEIAFSI